MKNLSVIQEESPMNDEDYARMLQNQLNQEGIDDYGHEQDHFGVGHGDSGLQNEHE